MSEPTPVARLPALFEPYTVRSVTLRNRLVVTPMCQYAAADGHARLWHLAHHGRFSLSGVGAAVIEATAVTRDGRITPGCLGIYEQSHVAGLREIVALYHDQKVPVGIQLAHAGRKASAAVPLEGAAPLVRSDPTRAWEAVAPSAIPMMEGWPAPRALANGEIEELIAAFAAAATRACSVGLDFVEIHGAHGYLINSFLSPLANQRTDQWGGSLENRMRFALAVTRAVRAALPDGMPLLYRTSCVDGIEGGVTLEDTIALARELKRCGVDVLDCSTGGIVGASGRALVPPSPGYLIPYAHRIRHEAQIATMTVGLIVTGKQAEEAVAGGSADLVAIGRQLLEDPNFPYHAARELGHPRPLDVLPASYAFFLERRRLS
ncbi:MAG TPA: NADH:flavin oxidoreductase/NADH oxidase [Steroidobacteraceae bacterium]|nr:NADH:flavin oxidoreductase/NADH oxidase [Steroidobacteraceae bacterium]